jgi:hypothetical protein
MNNLDTIASVLKDNNDIMIKKVKSNQIKILQLEVTNITNK